MPGKLDTRLQRTTLVTIYTAQKLTKSPQGSILNPFSPKSPEDAPHPPSSQLHWKFLPTCSLLPLVASPHQWVLRKPSSCQRGHCPMVQKPKPWRETKLLVHLSRSKLWVGCTCARRVREVGSAPPVGHQRSARSTALTNPEASSQMQFCCIY